MYYGNVSGTPGGMPPMDPNAYAMQYAQQNGIGFEEAKAQLRAKYGNPTQPGMSKNEGLLCFSHTDSTQVNFPQNPYAMLNQHHEKQDVDGQIPPEQMAQLKNLGIPEDVIRQGDDAIRKFAEDNNIFISN